MRIEHITEGFVRVHKVSILSGKESSMILPVSEGRMKQWQRSCMLIQDFFSDLSDDAREFLMSGITREEWEAAFPDGDE